ncbi:MULTISPECIES: AfsR/SARP family transcriptional regulator [Saccharothrix]|uniref:AfsR/SARP family transcriptional regulator n=1 Tax=Saccharothrix TaxID=2071 RepID=UPI00093FB42D|nr:BTAD domain-containing putative transcriptional regulator [Saccharothrix sp. CB00851]OKI35224.1 transcriptional regulator, SARP family protein [Saccharothrix sp. CB00851]
MADFRLLGDVAVAVGDRTLDLGPDRQRRVLAALAVDVGRVVSVERLIERVWHEAPPSRARATLVSYLSRLRHVLADAGAGDIARRPGGYALEVDPAAIDLHRFRDRRARARTCAGDDGQVAALLREALGLWRGEALTGLGGGWAAAERVRLHQERLDAEHDLVDAQLRLGHGEDLVPDLASRVVEWPLDERLAGQYVLALHRSGRTADALAHYRQVRRHLVDELGTEPGAALQELHQRILAADTALSAPASTTAEPVVAPVVVPRQLPAAPPSFVGRRDELDRLDAGPTAVWAIVGAGGIGKTSLALHWAHRHADEFPDGQLFVDLRGFSPDSAPMDPAVALRGFLHTLGVPADRIPVDLHAQAALFRSLVADQRVLLVLDNALDTAQVLPLLPGGRFSTVVVTSRNRLSGLVTGHGAQHVSLDVLSDAEARALLTDRLGPRRVEADPASVRELIRFCGGFPLALNIVAGHADTRPHLPTAALVAELRDLGLDALDDGDPTASLPTVLSWSHRALTPEQATAFALLGSAPGPDIGLPAAAGLTGLSPARAQAVLRALERASLVTQDTAGRWRMHDLIRTYAATTAERDLPDDVRREAADRLVDHYLHTACTAERLLDPHAQPIHLDPPTPGAQPHPLPDESAAMAWLDAQHPHVLAVQQAAASRDRHDVVWRLAWSLTNFHQRRGHLQDQLVVWRTALRAAEHLPDPVPRMLAHRRLGRVHTRLGRFEQATEHLHRALAQAEHHHDLTQQAHSHHELMWAWLQRCDDRQALEHAQRTLDLYREFDQPVWEARGLNAVGWCAARLGDYDTARAHCHAALALHRRHHGRSGEADVLDSLGYIDHRTGHHQLAVEHYRQAVALRRILGNTTSAAETLERLGHPQAALGQADEARTTWREALDLYRQQGRHAEARRVQENLDTLG